MNDFYQEFLTDKSFLLLTQLKRRYEFILIGGWAVYFYTKALKSKDIDIIVDYAMLEKIKSDFPLEKNERLKKYQIKLEEIDVDIYVPYYSDFAVPVKDIFAKTFNLRGFILPEKEILLILKIQAFQSRKGSVKGQKDLIDLMSLILLEDFDYENFLDLLKKYKLREYLKIMRELLMTTKEVDELDLNRHAFAKRKREILAKLSSWGSRIRTIPKQMANLL